MMLMLNAVVVFVYYRGGVDASNGVMDVSEISVFASYIIQVLMNLMMISMMLLQLARGKACGDRVVEVLNTEVDIKDGEQNYIPDQTSAKGRVEFRNVDSSIIPPIRATIYFIISSLPPSRARS